jgi:hypothetical protein
MNTTAVLLEDDSARRWRQWQMDYAVDSRRGARHARIVFGLALTAATVWLFLNVMR